MIRCTERNRAASLERRVKCSVLFDNTVSTAEIDSCVVYWRHDTDSCVVYWQHDTDSCVVYWQYDTDSCVVY